MNTLSRTILASLLGLILSGGAYAHDNHDNHDEHAGHTLDAMPVGHAGDSTISFADVPLIDQHGRTVQLEQDLVADRIVVMSFIYTSCTTVCPLVSSIMGKLQQQLGERVGTEVQLVSISIDPQTDTPERLLDYSRHFQQGPGWSWLTGSPAAVTDMLKALGTWNADFANHPPMILVGTGDSRQWSRYYGFTDPEVLLARVDELAHGPEHHAHMDHHAQGVRP